MSRYTVIRYSMILAAVTKPLLVMAIYLRLSSKVESVNWLFVIAALFFITALPSLRIDPVEDEEARRRANRVSFVRALCAYLIARWILDQPEAETFLSGLASRLWDWRPLTVVAIFCLMQFRTDMRAAFHFKFSDLYPHLKREPQPEVT
jgi:hypothetical protein